MFLRTPIIYFCGWQMTLCRELTCSVAWGTEELRRWWQAQHRATFRRAKGERQMTEGFHITLENRIGGELDGRYAASEEEITEAVIALARECVLDDGDVIRITKAKNPTKS
jgi:hypothetical protein